MMRWRHMTDDSIVLAAHLNSITKIPSGTGANGVEQF